MNLEPIYTIDLVREARSLAGPPEDMRYVEPEYLRALCELIANTCGLAKMWAEDRNGFAQLILNMPEDIDI